MSALLFCPFCNDNDQLQVTGNYYKTTESDQVAVSVLCCRCGATGPKANDVKEAHARWNERGRPMMKAPNVSNQ